MHHLVLACRSGLQILDLRARSLPRVMHSKLSGGDTFAEQLKGIRKTLRMQVRSTSPAAVIKKGSSTTNFDECSHPSENCFVAIR